jgi:hypothetical protein
MIQPARKRDPTSIRGSWSVVISSVRLATRILGMMTMATSCVTPGSFIGGVTASIRAVVSWDGGIRNVLCRLMGGEWHAELPFSLVAQRGFSPRTCHKC